MRDLVSYRDYYDIRTPPRTPRTIPALSSNPAKEVDNASMLTTSTFSSTVSLLKSNLKSKFSSSKEKVKNKTATANTKIEEMKSTSIATDINGDQKTA